MRLEENKSFRKDLDEANTSKGQLSDQLSDARAEAASWQHQLTAAEEKLDALKERLKHERAQKLAVEQDSEVCSCLCTLLACHIAAVMAIIQRCRHIKIHSSKTQAVGGNCIMLLPEHQQGAVKR